MQISPEYISGGRRAYRVARWLATQPELEPALVGFVRRNIIQDCARQIKSWLDFRWNFKLVGGRVGSDWAGPDWTGPN